MIRVANKKDITSIETILSDAIAWMKKNHIENHWSYANTQWNHMSNSYEINDFYIYFNGEQPAGCMAITDRDNLYWKDDNYGESLYIHKLAVKHDFRGMGISSDLINFAKEKAKNTEHKFLKLDCNAERSKLRKIYENEGFLLTDIINIDDGSRMALYTLNVDKNYNLSLEKLGLQ